MYTSFVTRCSRRHLITEHICRLSLEDSETDQRNGSHLPYSQLKDRNKLFDNNDYLTRIVLAWQHNVHFL